MNNCLERNIVVVGESDSANTIRRITDIKPDIEFTAMHGNAFAQNEIVSGSTRNGSKFERGNANKEKMELLPPLLVSECHKDARSSYDRSMKAHEFMDEPQTLQRKIEKLAELLTSSKACVAYTGAGLSTGAGIADYASRNNSCSITSSLTSKDVNRYEVLPGLSHHVLYALHQKGYLPELIQQNHDGLPQKAGFPQHCVNEIHGAWFDPSNPVVSMSGTLRKDLVSKFDKWKKKADLVLALGTSLAAVGADSIVDTVARKQFSGNGKTRGVVIISLQQTYYDDVCALRIFGKLDEVLGLLARHMGLHIPSAGTVITNSIPRSCITSNPHIFRIPYKAVTGERSTDDSTSLWNLSIGSKLKIVYGPGDGKIGRVVELNKAGHYVVEFPRILAHGDDWLIRRDLKKRPGCDAQGPRQYLMGCWWVVSAAGGLCDRLPFVSVPHKPDVERSTSTTTLSGEKRKTSDENAKVCKKQEKMKTEDVDEEAELDV